MTLETLLDEIASRGWLVNNLFQRDDGSWQANLRTETHHTAFAIAETPALTLALSIDQIETAIESEKPAEVVVYNGQLYEPTRLESVLAKLLKRPAMDRRI